MKGIFACAAAAALTVLSGCAGMALHRGYDEESSSFVSLAAPKISVRAAEGFGLLRAGRTLCTVPFEDSLIGGCPVEAWYSLSGRPGAQLAVVLAECGGGWVWTLGGHRQDYHACGVVYESLGSDAGAEDIHVYIRPLGRDPWIAAGAEASEGWENGVLVARFDSLSNADRNKLVIEYREPAPVRAEMYQPTREEVSAFLERAKASYEGFLPGSAPVRLRPSEGRAPADRLLGPVIGSVEPVAKIFELD